MSGAGTWVTARMPSRCRFCCTGRCTQRAIGAARHDDADLVGQRQPLFEHAGHALERVPGRGERGAVGHAHLALAVVAQPRGLQDAGQQRCRHSGKLHVAIDQRERCAGHAAVDEMLLLDAAVLAHRDAFGRRRHRPVRAERVERAGRHVLELGGDRRTALHQLRQARLAKVVGLDVIVRDQPGRAGRVGVEHGREVAHRLRGLHEHAAELAAAHHAQRGRAAVGTERAREDGLHLSSLLIARAASVWRAR